MMRSDANLRTLSHSRHRELICERSRRPDLLSFLPDCIPKSDNGLQHKHLTHVFMGDFHTSDAVKQQLAAHERIVHGVALKATELRAMWLVSKKYRWLYGYEFSSRVCARAGCPDKPAVLGVRLYQCVCWCCVLCVGIACY